VDKLTQREGRGVYAIEVLKDICPGSTIHAVEKIKGGAMTKMI
jgi:hypothetical protein